MKERHIGFTGTREGMSDHQKKTLRQLMISASLHDFKNILHHGDCKGADEEAHEIAVELGWRIIIHPPIKRAMRAYCTGGTLILPALDYLPRDREIVRCSNCLFAAPKSDIEEQRSGTWYTVRFARSIGKRVILLSRGEEGITLDTTS